MTERSTIATLTLLAVAVSSCMTGAEKGPVDGPSLTKIQVKKSLAAVEFSADSKFLVHLDATGGVRFWDVFAGETARSWSDEKFKPHAIVVGGDMQFAVASGSTVQVRRLGTGLVAQFEVAAEVDFMRFDQVTRSLAVVDVNGVVDVFDIASQKRLRTFRPDPTGGKARVVPGAGFGVLFVHEEGRVKIVQCGASTPGIVLNLERKPGSQVSLSADRSRIALFNPDGRLEVRSVPEAKLLTKAISVPWDVEALQLSPDGSVLAIANQHAGVLLWDTAKNEELDRFESKVWTEKGVGFSHRGHFLAWVEKDRRVVRFWSPVRGVVLWEKGQPVMLAQARGVCRDLATTIRYRRASLPFERGSKQLKEGQNVAALHSFGEVAGILPNYPGLSDARAKAEERRDAKVVRSEFESAEKRGDYRAALKMLDEFVRDRARFGDYGFRERAKTLHRMIAHLDAADEHRKAGRDVDAVIEFEAATKIEPALEGRAPAYLELRENVLATLKRDARQAFEAKDYLGVLKATNNLGRLRPLSGEALMRLGVSHELLGNAIEAEKVYLRVPDGTKEFGAARRSIARIARVAGDYTKARRHLEFARNEAYVDAGLEKEYAEVCELCKDHDAAVAGWNRVGILEPRNPAPFASIASIEELRERWEPAAAALRTAIERSQRPRPQLLVRLAAVLRKAGGREKVVAIYRKLLELIRTEPEIVAFLGASPRISVENWIRELDYVQRSAEWIPRAQFLEEQGWERHDDRWLRPREARLREVAQRYKKVKDDELRAFSDGRYHSYAGEHRITKGMNRTEVIEAWGFFTRLTVLKSGADDDVVFEQLNFAHTRKVYLRNGLVCYWSE